jgi:hypothetical protein
MSRARLLALDCSVGVALGLCFLTGCGDGTHEQRARANDRAAAEATPRRGDGDLGLAPATYREGDRVVLPVTFPDGTRAELVYPPELDIAGLGVFPYGSGTLHGTSPTPERSDFVARDFWIRYGELDDLLALRNGGAPPALVAQYEGADGKAVGLWDLHSDDTAHKLGFQFGGWAVLVYDYVAVGAMTDAERASWAASFSGRETREGFLVLASSSPLRLARVGDHAGPQLTFAEAGRALILYPNPGTCRPHDDRARLVDGRLVSWNGGFANWCLSDSMRIHAEGDREFIGALIRELDVRNVTIAKG